MPAKFTHLPSTFTAARISIALFLTVLLIFPDGVAMAQNCTNGVWTPFPSASELPTAIETLNAVVNNGYLYVVGGSTGTTGFQNTVSFVQLSTATGLPLTAFNPTTHLPVALSRDLCGVAYNGFLYTVGGVQFSSGDPNGQTVGYVQRAGFHPANGTIGAWTNQPESQTKLPPVQLHGVVAMTVGTTGYMYVIGGSTYPDVSSPASAITDAVYYAKINSDGSVGAFTATASLPVPLYKTCPVVVNGTIYMSGGESSSANPPAVDTVYYAKPNSDGSISTNPGWQTATNLLHIDAPQAVAYVNTKGIVLMGGDSCGTGCDWNTVYEGVVSGSNPASINWKTLTSLPDNGISRNAGATLNHYSYSVGGLENSNDSKNVYCMLIQ